MEYDYLCTSCQHTWIIEAKITDPVQEVCPKCSEKSAKRLISSGIGFQLKGNGWFKSGGY